MGGIAVRKRIAMNLMGLVASRILGTFLLGVSVLATGPIAAGQKEQGGSLIVYIGTNDYPLENAEAAAEAGVKIAAYNLDAKRNLENSLMAGLPTKSGTMNIEDVQRIVEQRFNALSPEEVRSIFEPVSLAQRWDIRKAPAFVFGSGEAVIYGITDAVVALEYWQDWRDSQGGPTGDTP